MWIALCHIVSEKNRPAAPLADAAVGLADAEDILEPDLAKADDITTVYKLSSFLESY